MRRDGNAIIGRTLGVSLRRSRLVGRGRGSIPASESSSQDVNPSSLEVDKRGAPSLFGLTAAVKDNFVTARFPTTCASDILQDFSAPSAMVVKILKKAEVDIVGKTNMDEFGMGSHSTNSAQGAVANGPYHGETYSAGGSSGGSAMAVALSLADFAIGSDTGGSVRLPAAYTRTVGFKPSYGRISRNGLVSYANSLDTVGIIAKSSEKVQDVFAILDQPDSKDPTCLGTATRSRIKEAARKRSLYKAKLTSASPFRVRTPPGVRICRIGVPIEYNIGEIHPLVRKSWMQTLAQLRAHGHEIVPISLPSTMHALPAYYILAPAEASSNLAKYDGVRYGAARNPDIPDNEGGTLYAQHRGTLFGDEVRRRILLGSYSLSAGAIDNYFIKAQKIRRLVQHDFNLVFRMPHPLLPRTKVFGEGVDYIVCPTAPTPPPLLEDVENADPLESYMNDVFTVPASLAGLPAISIPPPKSVGEGAGLERHSEPNGPDRAVGMQIIGQFGDDEELLTFAVRESRRFNRGAEVDLRSGWRRRVN